MRARNRPCAYAADGERVEFIARRTGAAHPCLVKLYKIRGPAERVAVK